MLASLVLLLASVASVATQGLVARGDPGQGSWYTSSFSTICTTQYTTTSVVPCTTPLQWTNTAPTPVTTTTVVTIPITSYGSVTSTLYTTSTLTTIIPQNTTITDYITYYTSSTIVYSSTYTTWTTETLFTGLLLASRDFLAATKLY